MSEIQNAMSQILSGNTKLASAELVGTAKLVQAAEIFEREGLKEEAAMVIDLLKGDISKRASDSRSEETLIEISE